MKSFKRVLFVLVAVMMVSGAMAFGQSSAPQSGPSDLLDVYKNATAQWSSVAFGYANKLFGLLAVIDFAWAMIILFIEGQELQGWIAGFLKKFMTISFFYAVLINQSTWFPAIVNSFVQIGQQAGGVSGYLNPSDILYTGLKIGGSLLAATVPNAAAGAVLGTIVPGAGIVGLIPSLLALFCAIVIVLAYVVITFTFIMATVESYVVMSAGIIFLGFGASRWTVPYTERYFSTVISTGVRLMVIYMIVGLGNTMSATWIQQAQNLPLSLEGLQSLLGLLATVLIYMALAWQVPKLASSLLSGSLQMGSSDLIAPAVTAAVAAGTIGAAVATGGAALAGGAGALAGAGGAAAGTGGSFAAAGSGGGLASGGAMGAGNGAAAMGGVEGAINGVAPPAVSTSSAGSAGSGASGAVQPPPVEGSGGDGGAAPSGGAEPPSIGGPVAPSSSVQTASGVDSGSSAGTGSASSAIQDAGSMGSSGDVASVGASSPSQDAGSDTSTSAQQFGSVKPIRMDSGASATRRTPTVHPAGKTSGSGAVGGSESSVAEGVAGESAAAPVMEEAAVMSEGVAEVTGSASSASGSGEVGGGAPASGSGGSGSSGSTGGADTAVSAPQSGSSTPSSTPRGGNKHEVMDMVSRGEISAAEGEAQLADLESGGSKRSLGERVNAVHNAGTNVRQHLPEDSANIAAPTLNINHGE